MKERIPALPYMGSRSERWVARKLQRKGYQLCRGGWPDFLAYNPRTGSVCAVEVKTPNGTLSPCQDVVHRWLRRAGLHVVVMRPALRPYNTWGIGLDTWQKDLIRQAAEIKGLWKNAKRPGWGALLMAVGGTDGAKRIIRKAKAEKEKVA